MLDRARSQDTELPAIAVLLRGMRAPGILNVHRSMSMIPVEGIWVLEGVPIRILKTEVLVKHWVIVVEASEVKTRLRCEGMMAKMCLAVLNCLSRLRLQCTVSSGQLLMKNRFGLHPATCARINPQRCFMSCDEDLGMATVSRKPSPQTN